MTVNVIIEGTLKEGERENFTGICTEAFKVTRAFDGCQCIDLVYNLSSYSKSKEIDRCSSKNIENFFKEFYKRLIIPFYIPILTLVPFLLLVSSKENTNYLKLKLFTFVFGLIVIIFSETTIRFITDAYINNFMISIFPLFLILLLYLFFLKRFKLSDFKI